MSLRQAILHLPSQRGQGRSREYPPHSPQSRETWLSDQLTPHLWRAMLCYTCALRNFERQILLSLLSHNLSNIITEKMDIKKHYFLRHILDFWGAKVVGQIL